ncbi:MULTISPECIES: TetR/AcrR family transcriptional regulator [unclassified Micromonospora]|uniref:TetR/AcrR family transcriptional regulator n=1 Tax=unclassified Micromonospora TaxID=2617518 RepID=UPI003625CE1D
MKRTRPVRPRGEAARTALIDAAVTVVERDGVAAATTRQIAEEAGLPLGTVHYWFAGKDELFRAVIDTLLGEMRDELAKRASLTDPAHRLADTFAALTALRPGRQLALFELTTYVLRNEQLRSLAADQYAAYRTAAEAGLEPWRERADRSLPGGSAALAALLVAVFDGLTLAALADPADSRGAEALTLFSHLLTGAGLDGSAPDAAGNG